MPQMHPPQKSRKPVRAVGIVAACLCASLVIASDTPEVREYPGVEYSGFPRPADYDRPAEWTFARLMYPTHPLARRWRWAGDWSQGGTSWTIDYPRGDRHIAATVRRLTNVDARSVEQAVNLDADGEVFYWPWLYVVEPGTWALTDAQADTLREYLLRGGFLMTDDFHGNYEWSIFEESMHRVFPDRPIVPIPPGDQILHTIWDIDPAEQIPGAQFLNSGRTFEEDGYEPRWSAIYDDEGRIMVAICHNMDLGDAVEHADTPEYPETYSAQAMRIFGNYIVYALTH
jgi:hypothetical protein